LNTTQKNVENMCTQRPKRRSGQEPSYRWDGRGGGGGKSACLKNLFGLPVGRGKGLAIQTKNKDLEWGMKLSKDGVTSRLLGDRGVRRKQEEALVGRKVPGGGNSDEANTNYGPKNRKNAKMEKTGFLTKLVRERIVCWECFGCHAADEQKSADGRRQGDGKCE